MLHRLFSEIAHIFLEYVKFPTNHTFHCGADGPAYALHFFGRGRGGHIIGGAASAANPPLQYFDIIISGKT
jgi:hypothetical protein